MRKCFLLSIAAAALTVAAAEHPMIGGTWVLDTAHCKADVSKIKADTLSITQQPESVQVAETVTAPNGKETVSQLACNTAGETCKIKDHGPVEVSFYYNGQMLVMSEIRHGNDWVVKRRLKPSDDGHTLTMEVMYLAPVQKTETLVFTKQ